VWGKEKTVETFFEKIKKTGGAQQFWLTASIPFFEKKPRLLYLYLLAVESPHL
jgi:hypothetical protein